MINLLTVGFAFFIFIYVFASQLLIYMTEGVNSKYFLTDFKVNIKSIFFTTFHTGILNFGLGVSHMLLLNHQNNQLLILGLIELIYIILLGISVKSRNIYSKKFMGWQYMVSSFLRIGFISTFILDTSKTSLTHDLINKIQTIFIILYLTNWIISILIAYLQTV